MNKTLLITGANAGLGYAAALKAAQTDHGCAVIIAGRSSQRISAAAEQIKKKSGSQNVFPLVLDLSSLASVRSFVQEFSTAGFPPLHCLICNAGIRPTQKIEVTQDGYEAAFGVNYLGHFLLTSLLLPHIAPGGRIIMVSSRTHDYTDVSPFPKSSYRHPSVLADPHAPAGVSEHSLAVHAYSNSKLCLTMFGFELDRRVRTSGKNISVNVFDPGAMPSSLMRTYPLAVRGMMHAVWPAFRLMPNMSTIGVSAGVLVRLALSEEYDGITGKYFSMRGCYLRGAKEKPPCPIVFDLEKSGELWAGSEELINRAAAL